MKKKWLVSLLLGILLIGGTSGCALGLVAGAAAGAAGYAYYHGELRSTENVALPKLWKAVQQMAKDAKLHVTQQVQDRFSAVLKAERADGTPITITLKRLSSQSTELRIRVGRFGNEEEAIRVRDMILRYLHGIDQLGLPQHKVSAT